MASRGNVVILLYVTIVAAMMKMSDAGDGAAVFVFGDSLVDVGTNNYLKDSLARADHPHYGIDFPRSIATGRFSNGFNTIDFLAHYIRNYTLSPPPFFTLVNGFNWNFILGANFASGGSGIFKDTGSHTYGQVVPLEEQIQQFATVIGNITAVMGDDYCDRLLQDSLYIISVGSNDLFDHEKELLGGHIQPKQFITNLTNTYATHLQDLYDLGARKFGIIGIPPLGCSPAARVVNVSLGGDGGCVDGLNDVAQSFYASTESLLQNFMSTKKGVVYSLGNAYRIVLDMIDNPVESGFRVVQTACCGNGTFNAETYCNLGTNLCTNRDKYLFWDAVHPTQAAAKLAALTLAFAEGTEYVTPMNFSSLANALTF